VKLSDNKKLTQKVHRYKYNTDYQKVLKELHNSGFDFAREKKW